MTLRNIEPYSGVTEAYGAKQTYSELSGTLAYTTGHIQNPGSFRTGGIFKSLPNISDEHAYSEPWHSQNSLFNHFQGYLGILRDIDSYSAALAGAQLGRKKLPDFGKKVPDCVFDEMFTKVP